MFKFLSYLSIDEGIDFDNLESKYRDEEYRFTESGFIIFPIREDIPLIQSGQCKGLANIKSITFTQDETTEVVFEIKSITRELANAYTTVFGKYARVANDFGDTFNPNLATPIVGEAGVNLVEAYTNQKTRKKEKHRIDRF